MKIQVELPEVEAILLQQILTDNADALMESWDVTSLSDLVRLLALHGADHLGEIVG